MRVDSSIRPVLVTGLGILMMTCMDTAMKTVSAVYPLSEVVGLRYAAGAVVSTAVLLSVGEALPGRAVLGRNFARAFVVLATAGCFFTALARLPLVEAIALTFLAPLFISLLGRFLLAEPVPSRIAAGIVLGFAGVVVIGAGQALDPEHAFDPVGILAALACAFFYALSNVLVRRQSGHDSMFTIVALSNVFVFLLAAPVMASGWQAPSREHMLIFALAGALGTGGHLCLAWAYARAPAARLGILEYTAFIWASLLGFAVFAEVPSLQTIAGAVIIAAACLTTGRRSPAATA